MTGASAAAFGEESVTDALNSVGFPHEGQNCFELSLHILMKIVSAFKMSDEPCSLEASVTPEDPGFHFLYSFALCADQCEPHLQQDVLHSKVRSHASSQNRFFINHPTPPF